MSFPHYGGGSGVCAVFAQRQRRAVRLGMLMVLVVCLALPRWGGAAEYPQLSAEVEPTSATIGEPIRLMLDITVPELARVTVHEPLRPDDRASTWTLLNRRDFPDQKLASGEFRRRIEYTLAAFQTGDVPLPPYEVTYQPAGGAVTTATLGQKTIRIASVLPGDAASASALDIKPPVPLPYPRWVPVVAILLAALLIALLLRAYWAIMRRRVASLIRPPKRLDEWALDELASIERERLVEQKKFREFYTRLTDTARSYLGQLYSINALDLTTAELLWRLDEQAGVGEEVRRRTADLLNEADLVKFARHVPDASASRRALENAREIVISTRYLLEPVAQPEGASAIGGTVGSGSVSGGATSLAASDTGKGPAR